jgi:hypothetical protein
MQAAEDTFSLANGLVGGFVPFQYLPLQIPVFVILILVMKYACEMETWKKAAFWAYIGQGLFFTAVGTYLAKYIGLVALKQLFPVFGAVTNILKR